MPKIRDRTRKRQKLHKQPLELKKLTNRTIKETIKETQKAIRKNYLFPEQTRNLCSSLEEHYSDGDYDHITDWKILCQQLTQHLLDIVNDKHLQVLLPEKVPSVIRQAGRGKIDFGRSLDKVEILSGNVGYVSVIKFSPLLTSSDEIRGAMQFVKSTTSLILDLRKCRGGTYSSANFLLSYFFGSEAHGLVLLETHFGRQNRTIKHKTTRTPFTYENPVYVLTSGSTFSCGEHFAFALKVRKRATLVGTNTRGGAHPVKFVSLGTGAWLKVPIARTYNPETNEDWEGVGVVPDIKCSEDDALTEAHKKALQPSEAETNFPIS